MTAQTAPAKPVRTATWQDKKRGLSTRKDFVMQTPITPWGTCLQTSISIYTYGNGEEQAYIDYGSNTPFFCSVEYARDVAKSQLEAGYKFI